ncbi:MAG TPA: STY0301 family protein [Caulobacteraceae bacterium]|jgi:hypothetical protein|nr:STY0301 family protein [Caulobacteraceae bacterium]
MLWLLLAAGPAAAQIQCPAVHLGAPLTSVSVFDGPPSEQADLVPDTSHRRKAGSRSSWDVGYLYQAGRKVFVACRYGPRGAPVTISSATALHACVYVEASGGRRSLACR